MHFHALSQQPNTKIQISNLILDWQKKKKKSIYTISQYINTNTHFLHHTTTFITHQTCCLSLSQSQSQMKTTKTIANNPHFLSHQINPSFLILNTHVSLVYQVEERWKQLRIWKSSYRFSNWIHWCCIQLPPATLCHQPKLRLTPLSLICLGVSLAFWIGFLGFWFWFCLEIWPPSQFGICPYQSHWIGLNTKTPTWLILGVFFFYFYLFILFLLFCFYLVIGKIC